MIPDLDLDLDLARVRKSVDQRAVSKRLGGCDTDLLLLETERWNETFQREAAS